MRRGRVQGSEDECGDILEFTNFVLLLKISGVIGFRRASTDKVNNK